MPSLANASARVRAHPDRHVQTRPLMSKLAHTSANVGAQLNEYGRTCLRLSELARASAPICTQPNLHPHLSALVCTCLLLSATVYIFFSRPSEFRSAREGTSKLSLLGGYLAGVAPPPLPVCGIRVTLQSRQGAARTGLQEKGAQSRQGTGHSPLLDRTSLQNVLLSQRYGRTRRQVGRSNAPVVSLSQSGGIA